MNIVQISAMARAYLAKNAVGGSLHIVLDDGNIDDDHITWCDGYAAAKGDKEGEKLAQALARLTRTERQAMYLADWHVPTTDQHTAAEREARDKEDEGPPGDVALQAEIDRRGLLIEEQERELNRLRAELQGCGSTEGIAATVLKMAADLGRGPEDTHGEVTMTLCLDRGDAYRLVDRIRTSAGRLSIQGPRR